ncbi:MBG domain-containing protein [Mucilaginibacter hurinus]|nr:MBG domain-containing protein [Mucilaginibacter hurinus]
MKCLLTFVFILLSLSAFTQKPIITSFSPASGPVGTLITATGKGLANPTSVVVGGKPAIVVSSAATKLVVMVMPGAVTGAESITTSGGKLSTSGNFKVTATPYPGKQQGDRLLGTGNIGAARQGSSVDISADGNTAVVGGADDDNGNGAVWMYTRINGGWTQQGPKLVGSGAIGAARQGTSVAISADGNLAVAGGSGDNKFQGALWLFARKNGVWSQQGTKLVPPAGSSIGYAVDISADGRTIVTGKSGSACIFNYINGAWSTGFKLTPTDLPYTQFDANPEFGCAVAISADGTTVAVGARKYGRNYNWEGAACIFVRDGNVWAQQGPRLTAVGAFEESGLGSAVALSADGNTVVVGAWYYLNPHGAAWVFSRTGTIWSPKGPKLIAAEQGDSHMGASVAISADGNTIAAGGPSEKGESGVWIFTKSNNGWVRQSNYLTKALSKLYQETSQALALSATGHTLIAGLPNDFNLQGGAKVFTPFPPKRNQTIAWKVDKTTFTYGDSNFPFTVTSTSGLPVRIFSDAYEAPAVIDIINNKMQINRAGTITFTAIQEGNDTINAATPATLTFTVQKLPVVAKINNVYGVEGDVLPQFSVTATDLVNGDKQIDKMYITTTATKNSPPGSYPLTGWSLSEKYDVTVKPGILTIFSAQTVYAPVVKTYGDAEFYVFGGHVPEVTYGTNNAEIRFEGSKARILKATTNVNESKVFVSYKNQTISKPLTINKAPLTIAAINQTKTEGSANPPLSVSYNGFVYGETKNNLGSQPIVSTTATISSPPGTYPINVRGATSDNYSFNYIAGTLTVTAAPGAVALNGLVVNQAVSPNGDGINDVLAFNGIEKYSGNRLTLMNSRGAKIFETANYGITGQAFNGRSNITQALQPAGTYFYVLEYIDNGTAKTQKGYVVLKYD